MGIRYTEARTRYSSGSFTLKEIRIITGEWKLAVPSAQAAAGGSQNESGS